MANTPAWRTYNAANLTLLGFLECIPDRFRAHVMITTKCRIKSRTKSATKALRRIVEKRLRPHCVAYVWVFHRNIGGYIHWHVIAWFKEPCFVIAMPTPFERMAQRDLYFSEADRESRRKEYLNAHATALERTLSAACAKARIGFKVAIEPVDNPTAFARYLTRYLRGVAETGRRYAADRGVRLWGVSKGVNAASCRHYILTDQGRRHRTKLAAYSKSKGFNSMKEFRDREGAKWAYRSRELVESVRLSSYLREEDFRKDFGTRWSPEALGIRILDPAYSVLNRRFSYRENQVADVDRDLVFRALRGLLRLPIEDWQGPAAPHSSHPLPITTPRDADTPASWVFQRVNTRSLVIGAETARLALAKVAAQRPVRSLYDAAPYDCQ